MLGQENVRLRSGWLLGLLYVVVALLPAQNDRYIFSDFTVKNGLSHANVLSIYEDKIGTYWIGTADGLTRILGNEIKNYTHHYSDSTSILSNRIQFVTEDDSGQLWVSTVQGLSKYFPETDSFEPVRLKGRFFRAYSYRMMKGKMCFGGENAIYQYDDMDNCLKPFIKLQSTLPLTVNYFKQVDQNRFLIVDKYRGVFWVDAKTGVVSDFPISHLQTEYNSYSIDSENRLWLAPYKNGLVCYSLQGKGKLLHHYTTDNSGLSHNSVTDIKEFDGLLWLATDGGGINILDVNSEYFQHITHSLNNEHTISSDFIRVLFEDSFGTKWAGMVHNGLIRIHEGCMKHFSMLGSSRFKGHGYRSVSSLCEDQDGNVWMGIEHSGLSKYDVRKKIFKHFPFSSTGSVMSVVDFDAHHLLLSFYGEGIYKCHKTTGKLTRFILKDTVLDAAMCKSSIGVRMYRSLDRHIQFYGHQFLRYSLETHQFETAQFQEECRPNSLQVIFGDEHRTLVHDNQAIYQINHADFTVSMLYSDRRNDLSSVAFYENIFYIYDGEGLKTLNRQRNELKRLEIPYNEKLDVVCCDENGHLWLVCHDAVICHVLSTHENYIFTEYDGFQANCFVSYAKLNSSHGYLYFGGNDGLLQIDKQWMSRKAVVRQPQLFLLSGYVGQQRLVLNPIDGGYLAMLPWNHSSVRFQVHVKNQEAFCTQEVKYLISGEDYYSEIYSNNNRLVLPTLQPGEYHIRAACLLKDGTWTVPQKLVQLTILPPWWKATFFLWLWAILLVGILFVIVWGLIRAKKRKVLGMLHIEKGKMAEEKVNFMLNLSHELKTPLSLVYAALKQLQSILTEAEPCRILGKMQMQVENMSQLINVILDVHKMERGVSRLHLSSIELNAWVKKRAEEFREEFESRGVALEYRLEPAIHTLNGDAEKCQIVLTQFLMNALKYSENKDRVFIQTSLYEEDSVRVSVTLKGNRPIKTTGLGLAYSKLLMKLQQGFIGFYETEVGVATLYFELPLHLPCETRACEQANYVNQLTENTYTDGIDQRKQLSLDFSHYTVMLVDDAEDFLDYFQDLLKPYFRKVYTAISADKALPQIKKLHPDLVISDVVMPGKNGFILCKDIKQDAMLNHIPVILLSEQNEEELACYRYGADCCLPKPFDTVVLLTLLHNLFQGREAMKRHILEANVMNLPLQVAQSNNDEQLLIKLNDFIKEHIDNPKLDMDMVSKHMCLSHSSLYTKVKNLTGCSLNDYLIQLRMKKAKEYLASTDKKIAEIATLVGFSDCRYFSTVFKKYEGTTPTQYKEQFQKKQ